MPDQPEQIAFLPLTPPPESENGYDTEITPADREKNLRQARVIRPKDSHLGKENRKKVFVIDAGLPIWSERDTQRTLQEALTVEPAFDQRGRRLKLPDRLGFVALSEARARTDYTQEPVTIQIGWIVFTFRTHVRTSKAPKKQ